MTNEELVLCIQNGQDRQQNLELLYFQNFDLIKYVVRLFGNVEEAEDLKQQAFIGLMNAADKWIPGGEANFSTFAVLLIKRELQRYINNGSSVHVPDYKGSLIWRYNRLEQECLKTYNQKPSDTEIMKELEISQEQLADLRTEIQRLKVCSLDDPIQTEEEEECTLRDMIPDPAAEEAFRAVEDDIFTDQLSKVLYQAMSKLEPRQRTVIDERYMNSRSAQDVAEEQGCSIATIKGIEARALFKLNIQSRRQLQPFWDEIAYSEGLKHGGYEHFNNTWTSSTEAAALRLLEHSANNKQNSQFSGEVDK